MITFIIPAHNEEFLIGRTICALQTAADAVSEPYEIIVVDDASTDATTTVAAHCGARVTSVYYRQIAAARNAGAAQAQSYWCSSMPTPRSLGRLSARPCT